MVMKAIFPQKTPSPSAHGQRPIICGDGRGGGNSPRVVNEGHLRSVVDVVLHEYFNWNDGDEVDEGDVQGASVNLDFDFKVGGWVSGCLEVGMQSARDGWMDGWIEIKRQKIF